MVVIEAFDGAAAAIIRQYSTRSSTVDGLKKHGPMTEVAKISRVSA
jgi:hypothetical protein